MYGVFTHKGGDIFKGYESSILFTGTYEECEQWMKKNPFKGDWIEEI